MKVYGTTLYSSGGQHRAVVAARSKAEAARAFNITPHQARGWCEITGNAREVEAATSEPGIVFWRPLNARYDSAYSRREAKGIEARSDETAKLARPERLKPGA